MAAVIIDGAEQQAVVLLRETRQVAHVNPAIVGGLPDNLQQAVGDLAFRRDNDR